MATITTQQALTYAEQAGFTGVPLITIVAIAWAESGLQTDVVNSIGATGILQIYLAVHPDVTSAQAKDPAFSFRYAYRLSGGGKNFCPWQSYNPAICGKGWDNRYQQYIPRVQAAFNGTQPKTGIAGIDNLVTNTVNQLSASASAGIQTFSLTSNATIAQALVSFDNALTLNNPFVFDTSGMQDNILGVTFTDPVQWLQQFGSELVGDLVALVFRVIFIALGIFLLYRVLDHYVNFTGMAQQATSTIAKVAPLIAA